MKAGLDLVALAEEIERQKAAKKDYLADRQRMQVVTDVRDDGVASRPTARTTLVLDGIPTESGDPGEAMEFSINPHTHGQISTTLGIPKAFYDKLRHGHTPPKGRPTPARPAVFDNLVNGLLHADGGGKKQMVRTLDGRARAFLSDRYRPLDNHDLAEIVLPIVGEFAGTYDANIVSSNITDDRFYLKVVLPKIQRDVKPGLGDIVQSGFVVQNSEVGAGALAVYPLVYRLICLNGMVRESEGMSRNHVGRAWDTMGDKVYEVFTDRTLRADDRAFWLKVTDLVRAAANESVFNGIVDRMSNAATSEKMVEPVTAINLLGEKLGLYESEKQSVIRHLIEGGDLTAYGALNAITRASQDQEDYERATELEKAGGKVLDLTGSEWRQVANATA